MGIELAKYPKKYIFSNFVWKIDNMDGLNKYLDEKINEFKDCYTKEGEKAFKKNLINEFFEIYDYDCQNSYIQLDEEHETKEQGNKKLLTYEMVFVIGNVFLGMHAEIVKDKLKYQNLSIPNRVINYNELYYEALNSYYLNLLGIRMPEIINLDKSIYGAIPEEQLQLIKMSHKHCMFTTLAMLPLIEYMLCEKLVSLMIYNSIKELFYKIQHKEVAVSKEDLEFFGKFDFKLDEPQFYTYYEKEMDELYDKLVLYGVLVDNLANKEILTRHKWNNKGEKLGRTMLGDILVNDYFKQNCEPEYYKLLKIIFGRKDMNLRNSISHGTGASFDYFNITFTSILIQLFWDIINNHIFVDNAIKSIDKQ